MTLAGPACFLSTFVAAICVLLAYISTSVDPLPYPASQPDPSLVVSPVEHVGFLAKKKISGPASMAIAIEKAEDDANVPVMYTGLADGRLVRVDLQTENVTTIMNMGRPDYLRPGISCGEYWTEETCGRPVGVAFDMEGARLIVVDAYKGLFAVDVITNKSEILASEFDGNELDFATSLAVSPKTDVMYFIQTSTKLQRRDWYQALLEARPSGRILSYDPRDGNIRVVAKGLYYPSGLSLLPTEGESTTECLVFGEPLYSRVRKVCVPQKFDGKTRPKLQIFAQNLPILPFSIRSHTLAGKSVVLTAGPKRSSLVDLLGQWPAVRRIMIGLPFSLTDLALAGEGLIVVIDTKSSKVDRVYSGIEAQFPTGIVNLGSSLIISSERPSSRGVEQVRLP